MWQEQVVIYPPEWSMIFKRTPILLPGNFTQAFKKFCLWLEGENMWGRRIAAHILYVKSMQPSVCWPKNCHLCIQVEWFSQKLKVILRVQMLLHFCISSWLDLRMEVLAFEPYAFFQTLYRNAGYWILLESRW